MTTLPKPLIASLAEGPQPGELYRHYKGTGYRIIARPLIEATLEPAVVYGKPGEPVSWCRTLADFTATVEVDGKSVPRFARVHTFYGFRTVEPTRPVADLVPTLDEASADWAPIKPVRWLSEDLDQ